MKPLLRFAAAGLVAAAVSLPAALAEDKKDAPKPYKLDVCLVSDEKLGEMGEPYVFTFEGQEIKFCCKSCRKDFDKDPKKYMAKLAKAKAPEKK